MAKRRLTDDERQHLQAVARDQPPDSREGWRARALLALDGGATVAATARALGVSRQTIYDWASRLDRDGEPAARLADAPRSGRPVDAGWVTEQWLKLRLRTVDVGFWGSGEEGVPIMTLFERFRDSGTEAGLSTFRRALAQLAKEKLVTLAVVAKGKARVTLVTPGRRFQLSRRTRRNA